MANYKDKISHLKNLYGRKKNGAIYFELAENDKKRFFYIIDTIQEDLTENNPNTLKLFNELMFLIEPSKSKYFFNLFIEVEVVSKDIADYSKKLKGNYYFSKNIYEKKETKAIPDNTGNNTVSYLTKNEEVSLGYMIRGTVIKAMAYIITNETIDKEEFIKVCYNELKAYKTKYLSKTQIKQITHYKLTTIIGLIFLRLGIDLNEEYKGSTLELFPPNAAQINHALKHFTNKFR